MRYRKHKNYKEQLLFYQDIFMVSGKSAIQNGFQQAEDYKGKWNGVFQNDHLVILEIGLGKGKFIVEMAHQYPNLNFIGVEKQSALLLSVCRKIDEDGLQNIKLISMDAGNLSEAFEKDEVSGMYIHFCDPWPKIRHSRRRLVSLEKLHSYESFLKEGAFIQFKTDNKALFQFALEEFALAPYDIQEIHENLKPWDLIGGIANIPTEYEQRFLSSDQQIYGLYGYFSHDKAGRI